MAIFHFFKWWPSNIFNFFKLYILTACSLKRIKARHRAIAIFHHQIKSNLFAIKEKK